MTFPWWFWLFPGGIFLIVVGVPVFGALASRRRK
jgi:hypothetical protein